MKHPLPEEATAAEEQTIEQRAENGNLRGHVKLCDAIFQNGVHVPLAMHMTTSSIMNSVLIALMRAQSEVGGV